MTEPLSANTLRELGAHKIRTFRSVQDAVLWYAIRRIGREGRAIPIDSGGRVPRSQESIDEANATFGRIAKCLAVHHAADEHEEPLAFAQGDKAARAEADRRIELLVAFYVSSGERFTNRLQDLGYGGRRQCERYVLYAERVLRRRFAAEGLLRRAAQ